MKEPQRIIEVYAKRDSLKKNKLYTVFNTASLYIHQERERAIINALKRNYTIDLADKKIFDLGCGNGEILRDFIKYGVLPENCYGIDLLQNRIEDAKKLSSNIDFRCGNAENLPYEDESFDIVLSFTVFSSILHKNMKKNIASEMLRVLKLDGIIIWYDYWVSKPTNPDVKGVSKREIKRLFLGCKIRLRRITLAPPITRVLAPNSWLLCYILEKIPILKTHYLAFVKKLK